MDLRMLKPGLQLYGILYACYWDRYETGTVRKLGIRDPLRILNLIITTKEC
jgi:hypothetical protein